MVGTFFYKGQPIHGTATSCTGSVVRSKGKNLVLTAGHCGTGLANATQRIFVPQYRHGLDAGSQPSGIFPITDVYLDPRYVHNTKGPTSDLDTAFATAGPSAKGLVENVTGGLTFTQASGYDHTVTVVGYPSSFKDNPTHRAITCTVRTKRLQRFRQMQMECGGYYGGVSGSPWIKGYDAKTRSGQVIGNLGGYNGGGNDANVDWVSYAPLFGKDAQDLYNDAANGIGPDNVNRPNPYQPPNDGPALPGTGETWKHAKQIASGDFSNTGHSDMLVIWTDGEATLYPGDGNGGFRPERQVLAPNAAWKEAATITAGDFTGSNQFDLLVRWNDGRMTLHGDVGSNGFGSVTEMAPSGSVWSHATQIAAGRFNAATFVTDLMVRWSDGELSLFTNVGAGTLGQEYKLKDPNSAWKDATLLTAGQYSGNQKWDLMVRWSSGALNNYVGTTTAGLGSEQPVHGPNKTWTHSVVMTTGNYTGDSLTNDLVIRWSDGETSMYRDTRTNSLGSEQMLVPPA
ncbi:FG-GAP-like repeat-containing protein [Streptomyces sp. NPDC058613]|uniref:FG-GAP-like repeat-containing protein n=1 Tax=Streptomyces sp. NPDC058613 TaxID=3346556 RepID=UPI003666F21E